MFIWKEKGDSCFVFFFQRIKVKGEKQSSVERSFSMQLERKIEKTVSLTVFDRGFPMGRRANAKTGT